MMRKLFILTAILLMAPIANGFTVSLNNTGTTIELSAFGEPDGSFIAMVIEPPGLLTNFVDGPQAPEWLPLSSITINGDSGKGWLYTSSPFVDGVWIIADFSASVPVWVSAYEGFVQGPGNPPYWVLLDRIQVPEPTTIALLALG
jgi:hypothetical protein